MARHYFHTGRRFNTLNKLAYFAKETMLLRNSNAPPMAVHVHPVNAERMRQHPAFWGIPVVEDDSIEQNEIMIPTGEGVASSKHQRF